ncbi:MAG TPA: class I SAM-dependent methyltransferase [Smithella sp.]|nr:class I SAM-dependent methyltransferase [Smithella sp.]HOQ43435.1 class I SAM-dependent methyltransferase [Smithellaceae bacterium]HOG91883.1 class I SAM-dependent methyltransferase [Smithella sp.]HPN87630.1 class I SAM-dependent methyltransferase [Smithella sp.]HPX31635.1 class I SAM-dependent methyltransferase [Smithella sp.]
MKNSTKQCILCGNTSWSLLYSQDQWKVYRCENCNLGVLSPRPDDDELSVLYQQDYFQSQYNQELRIDSPEMMRRLHQETQRLRFFGALKKKGKVLDIGCGRGYFLLACRNRGYQVDGIDLSEDVAEYVRRELHITVHVGAIDRLEIPAESYDAITMWHSLEHTADPNIYLQKARGWLKKDGILIVDVPNYAGHDAKKTWDHWVGWQIPYHLYHFTSDSLKAMLHKHGFTIVRHKHFLSEYVKQKLESLYIPSFIARIIARFYSGHSYAVVARKINGRPSPNLQDARR